VAEAGRGKGRVSKKKEKVTERRSAKEDMLP